MATENTTLSKSGKYVIDTKGTVTESATGRHIELPEFKSLGLNAALLPSTKPIDVKVNPFSIEAIKQQGEAAAAQPLVGIENVTGASQVAQSSFAGQQLPEEQTLVPKETFKFPDSITTFDSKTGEKITSTSIPRIVEETPTKEVVPATKEEIITEPTIPPTDTDLNQAIASAGTGGFGAFGGAAGAVSGARATVAAAEKALAQFQLLDVAEIKSIAMNPDLTKALAARRIAFINDPQSEYWLQRMALQNELNAATRNEQIALQNYQLLKPDLLYAKTDKDGTMFNYYANPLNPGDIAEIQVGKKGQFKPSATEVWQHYDEATGIMSVQYSDGTIDRQQAGTPKKVSGVSTRFSDTQTNKGASNARTSVSDFQSLEPDIQNAYINDGEYMKDYDSYIQTSFTEDKSKEDLLADIKESLDNGEMSKTVYDYYNTEINGLYANIPSEPDAGESLWSSARRFISNLF